MMRHFTKGEIKRAYNCEGDIILATIDISGSWVSNPSVDMLISSGWTEYTPEEPKYQRNRNAMIQAAIRERYSESSEYMVLRHYAADPVRYAAEFAEYNAYIESVIAQYPAEDD